MDKPVTFGIWTVLRQAPYKKLGEISARWVVVCPKEHEVIFTGSVLNRIACGARDTLGKYCPRCMGIGAEWQPGQPKGGYVLVAPVEGVRIDASSWKVRCAACKTESTQPASTIIKNRKGCGCTSSTKAKRYVVFGVSLSIEALAELAQCGLPAIRQRLYKGLSPEDAIVVRNTLEPISQQQCVTCLETLEGTAFERTAQGYLRKRCRACRLKLRQSYRHPRVVAPT
jgi:hypothetical protein